MTTIEIRYTNRDLIRLAPKRLRAALLAGTDDATAWLQEQLRTYPDKSEGRMEFVSEKQRRYFFWALKEGIITVPYRRTRTMAKAVNRRVRPITGGAQGIVGVNQNIAPYSRFVMDDRYQSRMHRGNWTTIQETARNSGDEIAAMYQARIRAALR